MKTIRNISLALFVCSLAGFIIPLVLTLAKFMPVETMSEVFSFYVKDGFGACILLFFCAFGVSECASR